MVSADRPGDLWAAHGPRGGDALIGIHVHTPTGSNRDDLYFEIKC